MKSLKNITSWLIYVTNIGLGSTIEVATGNYTIRPLVVIGSGIERLAESNNPNLKQNKYTRICELASGLYFTYCTLAAGINTGREAYHGNTEQALLYASSGVLSILMTTELVDRLREHYKEKKSVYYTVARDLRKIGKDIKRVFRRKGA